jgi:excinuclease ABC subunit C
MSFAFEPGRYPNNPGCYLMKDQRGQVLYVGKAKNLRRRLCSYFQNRRREAKINRMLKRLDSIEVILVNNETESLILENNLIKLYKPRFNTMMKPDNTGFSYIVLTGEPLPRLLPLRKHVTKPNWRAAMGKDGERRFGPYLNSRFRDGLLLFVADTYGLRTCHPIPKRTCYRYHLNKCGGVCEKLVNRAQYLQAVEQAAEFLSLKQEQILADLKQRMIAAAERLEFERAQRIKLQLELLESVLEPQTVELDVKHDQDILYFQGENVLAARLKRGALVEIKLETCPPNGALAYLSAFTCQSPAQELIHNLPDLPPDAVETLAQHDGRQVMLTPAQTVQHAALLALCELNYNYRMGRQPVTTAASN